MQILFIWRWPKSRGSVLLIMPQDIQVNIMWQIQAHLINNRHCFSGPIGGVWNMTKLPLRIKPLSGESEQVRANVFLDGLCMALAERSGGTAAEQTATQKPASHN